jgi:4-amino-4-deoxy-L-arabinose transferase-like glycosyltransferase
MGRSKRPPHILKIRNLFEYDNVNVIICKTIRLSRTKTAPELCAGIIAFVKSRLLQIIFILVLGALLVLPRVIAIDRFATVDEPYWLTAGSDFYYALGQRAFANTVYDYHPAVTTMWIIAIGMLIYFPQYRGFGQGYFDVYKDTLERFLLSHNHTPLGLLTASRLVQTVVIVVLLFALFWFLRRLLGTRIAIAGILLVSFDPFFLGHSRLLNHEGMLSLFVLISLLAAVTHLFFERKWLYLLISGMAAGFAQLTKSSSIVLGPLIVLLFLVELFFHHDAGWRKRVLRALYEFGAWFGVLALVYFVFWPGMWVAPGEMLYQVFGNALSYAFEGARLSVTGGVQTAGFQPHLSDVVYYIQSVLWRTTPIVWIGALLSLLPLFRQKWEQRLIFLSIFLIGFLFVLLFGIASGRNSAHYVLTTYVSLDILAAVGWTYGAEGLSNHLPSGVRRALPISVLGIVVAFQAFSALTFFPYYYTYYNPIMEAWQPGRQNPSFGYGDGLELAASYLTQKPDAANSTVIVFYGRGPFSYFYPGKTEQLKPVYADAENVPQLVQILHESKYIVIYYELERERDSPANVMRALEGVTPEKVIWLNGIEYIRIYRADNLSAHFYEVLQQ